jgi:hypothetical protein
MTRYELLINSISQANILTVRLFLFALFAVIAYPVLGWTPAWMRRPAQYTYLASVLLIFATVLFLGSGV